MQEKVIVCDMSTQVFFKDRIFDKEFILKCPGSSFWLLLKSEAEKRNWKIMTADVYLDQAERYIGAKALMISEMNTPFTKSLRSRGVEPFILFSEESPNVSIEFYKNLSTYCSAYPYVFLFPGVKKYLSGSSSFQTLYWPNTIKSALQNQKKWADRKLLVMVASYKQRFDVLLNKPFIGLRRFIKYILLTLLPLRYSFFRFKDLYRVRLQTILFFSQKPDFNLYGTNWEHIPTGNKKLISAINDFVNGVFISEIINAFAPMYLSAIKKLGTKAVEDKVATLQDYRFSICFENCVFPGYITEKVFDCFFAGSIPVYYGAPDIAQFIPKETFIDFRDFKSYNDLYEFFKKND